MFGWEANTAHIPSLCSYDLVSTLLSLRRPVVMCIGIILPPTCMYIIYIALEARLEYYNITCRSASGAIHTLTGGLVYVVCSWLISHPSGKWTCIDQPNLQENNNLTVVCNNMDFYWSLTPVQELKGTERWPNYDRFVPSFWKWNPDSVPGTGKQEM